MNFSFQKLFFAIASVFALFAILVFAKNILVPIGFAFILSFILLPLTHRFEQWKMGRVFSVTLSILAMLLIVAGGIYLFSTQILQVTKEFSNIKEKIIQVFASVTVYVNSNLNFVPNLEKGELMERLGTFFTESAGNLLNKTVNTTAAFFTSLLATIVFTFLLLIYRVGLTHACLSFFSIENRDRALKMFKRVQQVGKKYLLGMLMLMLVLGMANSIGLWIIGIDNPFLFGFLAAVLAVIPYVGTFIGAAIPIIYAFISYDSLWKPLAVILLFWVIQVVESNILSPRIVGGSLKINALAAILSIIIGASVWGIAGMILFLPFTAMLKVACEEYVELQPIALLIGEHNSEDDKNKKNKKGESWWIKIRQWFKA
jgi:predicted PurR-regulated permease PerM